MRDYGVVSPKFWIGETGKKLRGNHEAQVLALYLMTSPHSSMTGVFHCPILYMAHETGMTIEWATKALASLSEAGFCIYEEASEVVFVIRMAAYQIAEELKPSDNRVSGLRKEVAKMPEGRIRQAFLAVYGVAFCLVSSEEMQAPSKPLPSQEQDQEQDQGQKQEKEKKPRKVSTVLSDDFYPDETGVTYADSKRISFAVELESFRNWHAARGSTMKDWQAAWRTWCDKAVEFGRSGNSQRSPAKTQHQLNQEATTRAIFGNPSEFAFTEKLISGEVIS